MKTPENTYKTQEQRGECMKIKEEFKKRIDVVLDEVKDWAEWKLGKTGFEDKYNVEPKQK